MPKIVKNKRIFQIAKELNISHLEIMKFLDHHGTPADSHMAPVESEIYDEILLEFSKDKIQIERHRKEQARKFVGAVNVTGIELTKLDSSAKGGVAFAVTRETGIPIKFVGNGESLDDFGAFDPKNFVHDLLEPGPEDNNNEEAT